MHRKKYLDEYLFYYSACGPVSEAAEYWSAHGTVWPMQFRNAVRAKREVPKDDLPAVD